MLELATSGYQPPTGYSLIGYPSDPTEPPSSAYNVWRAIESAKTTRWLGLQAEYGITRLDFLGWSNIPFWRGPSCIHILLGTVGQDWPGFDTPGGWLAYHYTDPLGLTYVIVPGIHGSVDELTAAVTHEVTEALLDSPPGAGWYDPQSGEEDADLCASLPFRINGFLVSSYWSNQLGRCVGAGDM